MIARTLLMSALVLGTVVLRDADADDTRLLFLVGGAAGTVSVLTAPVILAADDGPGYSGRLTARVIDTRIDPVGWTLSASTPGCTALHGTPDGSATATEVRVYSDDAAVLAPDTQQVQVLHHSPSTALVLGPHPQSYVTAATVNANVTDIDTVVAVDGEGDAGAFVCPITQTVD